MDTAKRAEKSTILYTLLLLPFFFEVDYSHQKQEKRSTAVAIRKARKLANGWRKQAAAAHIADRGRQKARIAAERAAWEADGAGILEDLEL